MKFKSLCVPGALISGTSIAGAVNLSISGSIYTVQGFDGDTIENGSLVEVGYFLGVDAATSPSLYSSVDWGTFTSIDTDLTETLFTVFPGGVRILTDIDSTQILGGAGNDVPVRIGVRFFDSLESGRYNTFAVNDERSILELPSGNPTTPGTGSADVNGNTNSPTFATDFAWEDNTSPFQTTILVPEPSTLLSTVLAVGLLAGRRRRS